MGSSFWTLFDETNPLTYQGSSIDAGAVESIVRSEAAQPLAQPSTPGTSVSGASVRACPGWVALWSGRGVIVIVSEVWIVRVRWRWMIPYWSSSIGWAICRTVRASSGSTARTSVWTIPAYGRTKAECFRGRGLSICVRRWNMCEWLNFVRVQREIIIKVDLISRKAFSTGYRVHKLNFSHLRGQP